MRLGDEAGAMHQLWRAVRADLGADDLAMFRTTGRLAVPQAISIYKNAYWIRQHEVLRELFPSVERCLGSERFRELVRRYLRAFPSVHPELEHLGERLPPFLATQSDLDGAGLRTLATLEEARTRCALGPDGNLARLEEIQPATFATSRLHLLANLRIVELDAACLRVLAGDGLEVVGASHAVVARPRFAVVTSLVGREEHALLELVERGATIGDLLDHCDHDVAALHRPLERWFRIGWISRIEVAP